MNDLDLPWAQYALAGGAALGVYAVAAFGLSFVRGRLERIAAHTRTRADDALAEVLSGTSQLLLALAAFLVGVGLLDLPERWSERVAQLWFLAIAVQAGLWANRAVAIGLRRYLQHHAGGVTGPGSAAATLLSWGLRTLLWTVVLLAMLSNLGVDITAFVASLGVGGIAIALAVQNVLGDLLASLSIAVDKPFEVGDFIVLGSVSGTVEKVGIKSTRIRSLGGEQVVMSNTDLLKQTISNYKRLQERRVVFAFGIDYATPPDAVAAVPALLQQRVQASARLRFDRAHLKTLGESALEFEVVYHVLSDDYNVFMDEQQRINLALLRDLAERGIDFAFPSRTLYVQRAAAPAAPHAAGAPRAAGDGANRAGATRPVAVRAAGG